MASVVLLFVLSLISSSYATDESQQVARSKSKRQIFREQVVPHAGGRIPDGAFRSDRLALNRLNKEGIAVPDGVLLEARHRESHFGSHRHDADIQASIIKLVQRPDGRYAPPEGRYPFNNVVESTYIIRPPINTPVILVPPHRPITATLRLPARPFFHNNHDDADSTFDHIDATIDFFNAFDQQFPGTPIWATFAHPLPEVPNRILRQAKEPHIEDFIAQNTNLASRVLGKLNIQVPNNHRQFDGSHSGGIHSGQIGGTSSSSFPAGRVQVPSRLDHPASPTPLIHHNNHKMNGPRDLPTTAEELPAASFGTPYLTQPQTQQDYRNHPQASGESDRSVYASANSDGRHKSSHHFHNYQPSVNDISRDPTGDKHHANQHNRFPSPRQFNQQQPLQNHLEGGPSHFHNHRHEDPRQVPSDAVASSTPSLTTPEPRGKKNLQVIPYANFFPSSTADNENGPHHEEVRFSTNQPRPDDLHKVIQSLEPREVISKISTSSSIEHEYPGLTTIPETNFKCNGPGNSMQPDPETSCQAFHLCNADGSKESFLCPKGSRYDKDKQQCAPWTEVNCFR